MSSEAVRYYLDTNIYSHLWQPLPGWSAAGVASLRKRITWLLDQRHIVIVGSGYHLEELSGMADDFDRLARVRYLFRTARWALLLGAKELALAETRTRGALAGRDPFLSHSHWSKVRRVSRRSGCSEIAENVRKDNEKFASDLTAKKLESLSKLAADGVPLGALRKRWLSAERVDDWVEDTIRTSRELYGLPDDATKWPRPRDLPAIWAFHAYKMSRIVDNVGEGRKIQPSDRLDAYHYMGAEAYADALVTSDGPFSNTATAIPGRTSRVLSLDQFAEECAAIRAR